MTASRRKAAELDLGYVVWTLAKEQNGLALCSILLFGMLRFQMQMTCDYYVCNLGLVDALQKRAIYTRSKLRVASEMRWR